MSEGFLTELDLHAVDDFVAELLLEHVDLVVGDIAVHRAVVDSVAHAALLGLWVCEFVDLITR